MAKAITIVLLLAATAAFAAAHPGLGKGGILSNIIVSGNSTAGTTGPTGNGTESGAGKIITISHGDGGDGGNGGGTNCKCTEECRKNERQVCKEVEVENEVCKDEDVEEDIVVCEDKCFTADKIITIGHAGKGRRLLTADTINIMPHMHSGIAHAVINKDTNGTDSGNGGNGGNGGQQTVCRQICRPETKVSKAKKCKKVKGKDFVDCKVEVLGPPVCKKTCECDSGIGNLIGKVVGKGH